MRYTNFVVQTILLAITLGLAVAWIWEPILGTLVMLLQLIVGVWQFGGAVILAIFSPHMWRRFKRYIQISALYFAIGFSALLVGEWLSIQADVFSFIWVMIVPWAIASYCYIVTWRIAFPPTKRSPFLPNLSF